MNNLINIIKKRRSIRKYKNKNIPNEILNEIMETVRWSPSWANFQPWEIIIIKKNDTKNKLQNTLPTKGNPARSAIVTAPVLLAICTTTLKSGFYNDKASTKFDNWYMYDLGIITQTLCLTAHSLGLGTVIVGLFDHETAKKIVKIPEKFEIVTLIPIGYPEKSGIAPKRREVEEFIHYESY